MNKIVKMFVFLAAGVVLMAGTAEAAPHHHGHGCGPAPAVHHCPPPPPPPPPPPAPRHHQDGCRGGMGLVATAIGGVVGGLVGALVR